MAYVICRISLRRSINKSLMPKNSPKNWLQYSGVGMQMVATIMIFWWLGGKLENNIELFSEPWGQLLGLFFGIFVSMYSLINQLNR